jgi:hypothetical protein
MINVELIGGIGNNMFQYAIGRIIADIKNYNLYVKDIEKLQKYFPNVCNISNRITNNDNTLHVGYNSSNKTIQYLNIDELVQHNGGINFSGFFQKKFFYEKHFNFLKDLYSYNDQNYLKPLNEDIVIHIRLGDYLVMNWAISPQVYIEIIKKNNISYNKCYIVTDDPDNQLLKPLNILSNTHIVHQSFIEDLTMFKYAKRLIISQSTFSWWGAFLGNADKVYVPFSIKNQNYPWNLEPKLDDIDLIPINDKFIKVIF